MEGSKTGRGANNKKKFTCSKWHWKHEEDKLLTELVQRFGPSNWDHIADYFQGRSGIDLSSVCGESMPHLYYIIFVIFFYIITLRTEVCGFYFFTGKSCRLRWVNQLNPKIDKTPFSAEERQRLLELHQSYGNKWSMISSFFPGRTDNQLKNQYHVLVGTRNIKASCPPSSTNPHDSQKKGSVDLTQFESLSTHAGGSQFSNVSYHGNYNSGFTPQSTTMLDRVETPFVGDGSSSFYGKDQTWFAACCFNLSRLSPNCSDRINLEMIHSNQRTSLGDSIMSHASSSVMSELCQVVQPQKGLDVEDSQFIDFFGVGKSE